MVKVGTRSVFAQCDAAHAFAMRPVVPFRPMAELEPPETRKKMRAVLRSGENYGIGEWLPSVPAWVIDAHRDEFGNPRTFNDSAFDAFCALPGEGAR